MTPITSVIMSSMDIYILKIPKFMTSVSVKLLNIGFWKAGQIMKYDTCSFYMLLELNMVIY